MGTLSRPHLAISDAELRISGPQVMRSLLSFAPCHAARGLALSHVPSVFHQSSYYFLITSFLVIQFTRWPSSYVDGSSMKARKQPTRWSRHSSDVSLHLPICPWVSAYPAGEVQRARLCNQRSGQFSCSQDCATECAQWTQAVYNPSSSPATCMALTHEL